MRPVLLSFILPLLSPSTPAQDSLALVRYEKDLGLREGLIRNGRVFADLGGKLVARIGASARTELRARGVVLRTMGEPGPGEALAALHLPSPRPEGLRILLEEKDLLLLAGKPERIRDLGRPGVFHGGFQEIRLDRPYLPAPEMQAGIPEAPDPRIAALVGKVTTSNLIAHLKVLTAIHTRNARRPENATAVKYVQTELAKLKVLKVSTETFSSYYGPNVIAELPGLESPKDIVMVGAHLDSYVFGGYSLRSPGADDNGSGSSAVLEIARILSAAPLQKTVRFGWWNAEEFGLIGSYAYAGKARQRGDKILAYINTDMNAYRASGDTVDVDFVLNDSTSSLVSNLISITKTYVPTLGIKSGYLFGGTSDHRSFYRNGFPAAFPFEDLDKYSPYIHRSTDDMIRSTNDMNLSTLITKSVLAGVATLALPLEKPSFTLSATSGPSLGGIKVGVTGKFLTSVTEVKVGGRSVPFSTIGGLSFETPTSKVLGPVAVAITNPAGAGNATFTYVQTSPPALRVTSPLKAGAAGILATGGKPGDISVTFVSHLTGTTNLGLLSLDIGKGNLANLFLFHVGVLAAGGGTIELSITAPSDPKFVGLTFHFQAVHTDSKLSSLVKTNVGSLSIQ